MHEQTALLFCRVKHIGGELLAAGATGQCVLWCVQQSRDGFTLVVLLLTSWTFTLWNCEDDADIIKIKSNMFVRAILISL